jgi:hypothetical protein
MNQINAPDGGGNANRIGTKSPAVFRQVVVLTAPMKKLVLIVTPF